MSAVRSSDFVEQITAAARRKQRRIILPESMHAGVLLAAAMAHNDNIADCVLLGDVNDIQKRARELEITLPDSLAVMSPPAPHPIPYARVTLPMPAPFPPPVETSLSVNPAG